MNQLGKSQNPLNQINLQQIKDNYDRIINDVEECKIKNNIDYDINIMAVTKTVAPEIINFSIDCGIKLLGENRVQEFLSKKDEYKNADVHFIGGLQTNKVKYIVNDVSLIQSVDSERLAVEIDKQAKKNNKIMDILVEINLGEEISKGGILTKDTHEFIEKICNLDNLRVKGLMAIPPINAKEEIYFKMKQLSIDILAKKYDNVSMDFLSIGMSGDYLTAIKNGSNLIRIGSLLFGARNK